MSDIKYFTADEIVKEISIINILFRESRAAFPYMPEDELPPIVSTTNNRFYVFNFHLLTKEQKQFHNKIAHFHNQNFIIRLFSTLQYYGVYNNFKKEENPELSVLKDLRNKFGHTLGSYNKDNEKDRKLMRDLVKIFKLENKEYDDFPISIDTVIGKIIKAAINFINEQYP